MLQYKGLKAQSSCEVERRTQLITGLLIMPKPRVAKRHAALSGSDLNPFFDSSQSFVMQASLSNKEDVVFQAFYQWR